MLAAIAAEVKAKEKRKEYNARWRAKNQGRIKATQEEAKAARAALKEARLREKGLKDATKAYAKERKAAYLEKRAQPELSAEDMAALLSDKQETKRQIKNAKEVLGIVTKPPLPRTPVAKVFRNTGPGPQTIEALREQCGPYGDAAVFHVEWQAVGSWTLQRDFKRYPAPSPFDPVVTTPPDPRQPSRAVSLFADAARDRLGWGASQAIYAAAFHDLSPEGQREVIRIAKQEYADWEAADRPGLTGQTCERAYSVLQGRIRRHEAAPYPGSDEPDPQFSE